MRSIASLIPRNFKDFLQNGENKTRLISLILDEIKSNRLLVLNKLKCKDLYYSLDNVCYKITRTDCSVVDQLCSNQEEADTKLTLHALYALEIDSNSYVIIRNFS